MRIEWEKSDSPVDYANALKWMENRVESIINNKEQETIWFLEHYDVYTAGSSAKEESLLDKNKFPIYSVGRGGDYTYHGPGQRVVYFMLDLKKVFSPNNPDLRKYIYMLEQIIIDSLAELDIVCDRREGRIGVWVNTSTGEKKIAAIGVRVRKWISYHGIAINLDPDLEKFNGIIPCGISEYGVTSMKDLGKDIKMDYLDKILKKNISKIFGLE